MKYDSQIIDQVQMASDIVEIIGQFVPLKRAGRNFKGLCPFHQEKTPSFMVQPERQIFHCFGCSAGGDVFSFLMRYENITFPEALRQLAERAHITLPTFKRRDPKEGPSQTEQLYKLYRLATEYYHAHFKHPEKGRAAREYMQKRGFDAALLEEYQIGWAEDDWQGLFRFLSQKRAPESLMLRSGLIHRSANGRTYDAFRGRVIVPIQNLQGKVVAFGGRLLSGQAEGPKYLNSPENPVFQKRRELYGLHLAKRHIDRERRQILVVEGYLDCLRLIQSGFKASVATLGTALTEDHVRLLKRFADEAIVIYDGDAAGEAASLRGLEVFLTEGMSARLVRLPAGMDPDDYLKKEGPEAFGKLIQEAPDFFDYKFEILSKKFNRWDSHGLIRMTSDFLETFSNIANPVLLDHYLRRLAAALGVDEQSLRQELAKLKRKSASRRETQTQAQRPDSAPRLPAHGDAEYLLLAVLIEDPALRDQEAQDVEFQDPFCRAAFQQLQALGAKVRVPQLLHRLEEGQGKERLIHLLAQEWTQEHRQKVFEDCLRAMDRRGREARLAELRRFIARAEREGDRGQLGEYVKEYQELLKARL